MKAFRGRRPWRRAVTGRAAALAVAAALASACSAAGPAPVRDEPGMVGEPGGRFWATRRGPLEDTGAYVGVKPFFLDATEVTVAAYGECVKAGQYRPAGDRAESVDAKSSDRKALGAACNRDLSERAGDPVNCVAWEDARAYCAFAGKRLPTEHELEWAARNGERGTAFPWGDGEPGDRACWSGEGNGEPSGPRGSTCKAGSHPGGESAAGVKDLAGNVAEWTDTTDVYLPDSQGRHGRDVKIVRGGGYADQEPWRLAAGTRTKAPPERRSPGLGFRCAKSP